MAVIPWRHTALALLLVAAAGGSLAGPSASADAASRYRQERAACLSGQTSQSRATCLREAAAALQEARRGGVAQTSDIAANALRRCDKLPSADRAACVARMQGRGTVSGSVEGGGLVRELITRETLPTDNPAPKAP